MKLTKDMFDFEKYEYQTAMAVTDPKWSFVTRNHDGEDIWLPCSASETGYGLYRRPKPLPRYILLNEGEKLQPGDQEGYWDSDKGLRWYKPIQHGGTAPPGEVWRRKVQE